MYYHALTANMNESIRFYMITSSMTDYCFH